MAIFIGLIPYTGSHNKNHVIHYFIFTNSSHHNKVCAHSQRHKSKLLAHNLQTQHDQALRQSTVIEELR